MAYDIIHFRHPMTGQIREAPVGFSWTCLFFSFLPAFFRSDWKWGFIMFFIAAMTGGLSGLVFMFIYNRLYMKELVNDGFFVIPSVYGNNKNG